MTKNEHHRRLKARMKLVRAEATLVLSDIKDGNFRVDDRIDGMAEQLGAVKTELKHFREANG